MKKAVFHLAVLNLFEIFIFIYPIYFLPLDPSLLVVNTVRSNILLFSCISNSRSFLVASLQIIFMKIAS